MVYQEKSDRISVLRFQLNGNPYVKNVFYLNYY